MTLDDPAGWSTIIEAGYDIGHKNKHLDSCIDRFWTLFIDVIKYSLSSQLFVVEWCEHKTDHLSKLHPQLVNW